MSETAPAEMLGRYRLLKRLAVGGMAEVFLAQVVGPRGFSRPVVIKRMLPHLSTDKSFVDMFVQEAQIVGALDHPNIGQIYELGEQDGQYYMVMEYLDGGNLRQLCFAAQRAGVPLPDLYIARLVALAAAGLSYAHQKVSGLVHRDVSPDNLMLSRCGQVKVVDFGIAKAAHSANLTRTGIIKGKLHYMPPEQMQDEPLDARVDVFALGVCFYELVSGVKPFDGSSDAKVMHAVLHEPLRPIAEVKPDIPPKLAAVIHKALEKDRARRYQSMREMKEDIERFLAENKALITEQRIGRMIEEILGPDENAALFASAPTSRPRTAARGQSAGAPMSVAPEPSLAIAVGTTVGPITPASPAATVLWQKKGGFLARREARPSRQLLASRVAAGAGALLALAAGIVALGAGQPDVRPAKPLPALESVAIEDLAPGEAMVARRAAWAAIAGLAGTAEVRRQVEDAARALERAEHCLDLAAARGAKRAAAMRQGIQPAAAQVQKLWLELAPFVGADTR